MELLSDTGRWPDWYPGMTEIKIAGSLPEEGSRVAFKVTSAGMSMPITETVMEGMLSGRARWELTPEGDGTA